MPVHRLLRPCLPLTLASLLAAPTWALEREDDGGRIAPLLQSIRANPQTAHEFAASFAIEVHELSKEFRDSSDRVVQPLVQQALAQDDGPWQVPGVLLGLGGWAEARADFAAAERLYAKGLRAAELQLAHVVPGEPDYRTQGRQEQIAAAQCALDLRLRSLLVRSGRAPEVQAPKQPANDCANLCENLGFGLESRTLASEVGLPLLATARVVRKGARAHVTIQVKNVSQTPLPLGVDTPNGGGLLPTGDLGATYFPSLVAGSATLWRRKSMTLQPGQTLQGVWIIAATPMRARHRLDLRISVALPGGKQAVLPLVLAVPGAAR